MSESEINIQNVVASTKLADSFDLVKIESALEGAEYNKKKFPGMVYRVTDPKAAFFNFHFRESSLYRRKERCRCENCHKEPGR